MMYAKILRKMRFPTLIGLMLCMAMPLVGQQDRSGLTGTIQDASGAALVGAMVTALHEGSGLSRNVIVSENGSYNIPLLPIGFYTVTVEAPGFKTERYAKVELLVGQTRTLDAHLQIATLENFIEITDTAPPLDRSSAELGTVIRSDQVESLPVNGRSWAGLMVLAPGAINSGDGSQESTRFVGKSNDDNNWTFDGVDNTAIKDPTFGGSIRLIVSMDSIAEFKVAASLYSAESGGGMGGQVHLVSKSGSNEFHGGFFEYFRNSALDARTVFDGPKLPTFQLNQFGGNIGGPVVPNKVFFFTNFEALRQRQGSTYTSYVPSAALRSQVISTSPALKSMIEAYPLGQTGTSDPLVDKYVQGLSRTATETSGMARVDYNISDRTTVFFRYNVNDALLSDPAGVRQIYQNTEESRPWNTALDVQRTFSPTIVNDTRFGINRVPRLEGDYGAFVESFGVPELTSLPDIDYNSEKSSTISLINNLSIFKGRHNLKVGGEVRRIRVNIAWGASRGVDYSTMDDFINNRVDQVSFSENFGSRGARRTFWFGYLQDDIKLRSNLTLNLGLRYEYYSVVREVYDRQLVFDPKIGDFAPHGTSAYAADRNNWGPRVSFAWSPTALKDKTVIRAGFGIFYGPGQTDDVMASIDSTQESFSLSRAVAPGLTFPFTSFIPQAESEGITPRALDLNRRDMYTQQWGLSIQQMLPANFMLQVGYTGNSAHHLIDRGYLNNLDPITRKRPWPKFGKFDIKGSSSNSNYNGMQVGLRRRMAQGFTWQTEYSYGHAIDEGSIGGGENTAPQNVNDRAGGRGNSRYDIRHSITSNMSWHLPIGPGQKFWQAAGFAGKLLEGWELSAIHAARTGRAIDIQIKRSSSQMADGNTSQQRPDLVSGASIYPANKTLNNWFNIDAFAVPAKYTWGNLGRYVGRGPGVNQWDLSLQKTTRLGEDLKVAFRAEFFNAFNRPHFGNPGSTVSSASSFGRITSPMNRTIGTGTARQIQFMLRFIF